jgi:electron transfer flavoprotein beta subunit
LKLIVLCKYSRDVSEIRVDRATSELKLEGVPARIGGIDKNVVEAAVRLKEASGCTVEGICVGPAEARDSFKDVLAMGVDEMTLVADPFDGAGEAEAVVTILAAAIRARGPFDLVLCGFASDDGYTYQVGPRLAERLSLPLVSYVRQAKVCDRVLEAERDLEDVWQTVSVRLPAILTIAEEAFPPRRTTLLDAIKARQKPVRDWEVNQDLGLSGDALDFGRRGVGASEIGLVVERRQRLLKGASLPELADVLIDDLIAAGAVQEVRP